MKLVVDIGNSAAKLVAFVGIYASYEAAKAEKDANHFNWDILTIEEYPIYD